MRFIYSNSCILFWKDMSTMILENYDSPEYNNTTVALGAHVHQSGNKIKENFGIERLVIYQSEPLVQHHWFNPDRILENLQGADEVWDYDLENINFLREHGIEAKFRPPLYSKNLKRVNNLENPEIDILFHGTMTPYRTQMLHNLVSDPVVSEPYLERYMNLNIVIAYNYLGSKLDALIANSKIVVNINPYDGEARQQQTRISYLLTNNKCVLSERNKINYFGDQIVQFKGIQEMYEKTMYLLMDDKWRDYTQNNFEENSKLMLREGEQIALS